MLFKLFTNGKIYTAAAKQKWIDAVVTFQDTIVFAGAKEEAENIAGDNAEVIDLEGRLMLPGFIDAHLHTILGGLSLLRADLSRVTGKEGFREVIKQQLDNQEEEWLLGGGWHHEYWEPAELPDKSWIDDLTGDTPAYLTRTDFHLALANSAALKLAGITAAAPDPDGGKIMKDPASGEPTGILKDTAMTLVADLIPPPDDQLLEEAALEAFALFNRNGVTSVQDITDPRHLRIFQRLEKEKKITCRIFCRQQMRYSEHYIASDIEAGFGSKFVRTGGVKAFADGSLGSSTALFFEPYADDPSTAGLAMDQLSDGRIRRWSLDCDKNGLQISIHAIGEKANKELLDILEALEEKNGPRDRRFRLEHAQHIRPEEVERCSKLQAIVSAQPTHLRDDGHWIEKKIGKERLRNSYPFRSLLEKGVHLSFGTDWPVTSINPLITIHSAVTREIGKDSPPDGFIPEEKISVEEAVLACTIDAAYAAYEEDEKGSIEAGKLADFVVLDRDIFTIPAETIKNTKVARTILGGETVYQA